MMSSDWSTFTEKAWDEKAQSWNESSTHMWKYGSRKDILPFFTRYVQKNASVLDIGCGSGYSSDALDKAGFDVTGIDISKKMIDIAKKQYSHVHFKQGDVNSLDIVDETFENVLAINVLEWSEVPAKALQEIYRVLKLGGQCCVGVLGPTAGPRHHSYERLFGKSVMMNTMMPWELAKLAKECGFEIVDGFSVPKKWGNRLHQNLPIEAQQALSFMWVFLLRKSNGSDSK